MALKNRTDLKNYFKTGDKPTESQFGDLIDSFQNKVDDNVVKSVNGQTGDVTIGTADNNDGNLTPWKGIWTEGASSLPTFTRNGEVSENTIVQGTTPFGHNSLLWRCINQDSSRNADGGYNTVHFAVDRDKAYRFTVWVRRNSLDGSSYHGTNEVNNLNGTPNSNPYFWSGDLPSQNEWYLMVGIVHAQSYNGSYSGISGVYDKYGHKTLNGVDYKWRSDTINSRLRNYLYYAEDQSVEQDFWCPVVHALDGSEPSFDSLFMDGLDTGWRIPILNHDITNFENGYEVARYKRIRNIVHLEGLIKGGTEVGHVTVMRLPAGFRPKKNLILSYIRSSGVGRVNISPSGDVICYDYSSGWTSLSGISFGID